MLRSVPLAWGEDKGCYIIQGTWPFKCYTSVGFQTDLISSCFDLSLPLSNVFFLILCKVYNWINSIYNFFLMLYFKIDCGLIAKREEDTRIIGKLYLRIREVPNRFVCAGDCLNSVKQTAGRCIVQAIYFKRHIKSLKKIMYCRNWNIINIGTFPDNSRK